MIFKKPNDVFSYISHFIFAIVIATTYDTAILVFMNPDMPFLSDVDSGVASLEIFLAYAAIISGWVGYSRSLIKWQHTNTKAGALRFSLDIVILFCYFGLITSARPENEFQNYFLYWIISLFGLFSAWDLVKIKEYYEKNEANRNFALLRSFLKTVIFLSIFIIITITNTYIPLFEYETELIDKNIIYGSILLLITILLLLYRYWKWSVYLEPKNKKNKRIKK